MAFLFSLASVLAVRRRREEAEETALSQISSELETARQTLERVDAALRHLATQRDAALPSFTQAVALHEHYAHMAVYQAARLDLLHQITALSQRRQQQQQLYLVARRDRELLEQLEAALRAAHTATMARQEIKRNEDAFLARYLRR